VIDKKERTTKGFGEKEIKRGAKRGGGAGLPDSRAI